MIIIKYVKNYGDGKEEVNKIESKVFKKFIKELKIEKELLEEAKKTCAKSYVDISQENDEYEIKLFCKKKSFWF